MPKRSVSHVSSSAARSLTGPTIGWCDDNVDAGDGTKYVDLSEWEGRIVNIYCEVRDIYYCFQREDQVADPINIGAAAVGEENVPGYLKRISDTGDFTRAVVPKSRPILAYRVVSGKNGIIRVLPV